MAELQGLVASPHQLRPGDGVAVPAGGTVQYGTVPTGGTVQYGTVPAGGTVDHFIINDNTTFFVAIKLSVP